MKKTILILLLAFTTLYANAQWTRTSFNNFTLRMGNIGSELLAGDMENIYSTTDLGKSWEKRFDHTVTGTKAYYMFVHDPNVFLFTWIPNSAFMISTDKGKSFENVSPEAAKSFNNGFLGVHNGYVYILSANIIYRSPIQGIGPKSWEAFMKGLPSNFGPIDITFSGSRAIVVGNAHGVYMSPTNEPNFTLVTTGIPVAVKGCTWIESDEKGDTIFAQSFEDPYILLRSTDSGYTWEPRVIHAAVKNKEIKKLAFNGSEVYVGYGQDGVYVSKNKGNTWKEHNEGFKKTTGEWICPNMEIRTFGFVGNTAFAGTTCGVWKITSSTPNTAISEPEAAQETTIYPNPTNGICFLNSSYSNATIEIINLVGQNVYTGQCGNMRTELDLSSQTKGVYFYKILQNDKVLRTGKIILK